MIIEILKRIWQIFLLLVLQVFQEPLVFVQLVLPV